MNTSEPNGKTIDVVMKAEKGVQYLYEIYSDGSKKLVCGTISSYTNLIRVNRSFAVREEILQKEHHPFVWSRRMKRDFLETLYAKWKS